MKKNKEGQLDLFKISPTIISLLALCCGVSAIKYAYTGAYILSTSLILFACFLDGIDGRIARFFNASSNFGAEMDSLADMVNFGVAPGFLIYYWRMNELEISWLPWFAVMLLACCMAIRLARFNSDLTTKDQNDPLIKYFFKGVPAPAAAALVLFPIVLTLSFGYGFWSTSLFAVVNTIVVALLAGGTVPTPCLKKIKIQESYKSFTLIVISMLAILIFVKPWLTLSLLGLLYFIGIIIGLFFHAKFKRNKK